MKGRPIDHIVYEQMFPRPRSNDPLNFQAFLQRTLIPEVRLETQAFYGHIETQEAKYPGLDYNHPTHRIRLSRFPGHRSLFKAFDRLQLTPSEIDSLTKWEGTKWAKAKYEKEQGVTIRDTTNDGTPTWEEVQAGNEVNGRLGRPRTELDTLHGEGEVAPEEESDEEEIESVGVALNQRLREQAARRDAGESSVVMDEEWEQWFKSAFERGELFDMRDNGMAMARSYSIPSDLIPPNMLGTARAGQWSEIPELFHDMLRRILDAERTIDAAESEASASAASRAQNAAQQHSSQLAGWARRSHSELRLPAEARAAARQRAAEAHSG